jgi:AcrR family transcriptional regulator
MPAQNLATTKYDSAKMADRRARILEAARDYVAEVGYDRVTTRGLAERAGVSPATLFNIYGAKENLFAAAVQEHLSGFLGGSGPVIGTISQLAASVERMPDEIYRVPEYAKAVAAVFFSTEQDNPVREALRATAQAKQTPLLRNLRDGGQLAEWADPDVISDQLTNGLFAVIHDWTIGRISRRDMKQRLLTSGLVVLGAATKGDAAKEVARLAEEAGLG